MHGKNLLSLDVHHRLPFFMEGLKSKSYQCLSQDKHITPLFFLLHSLIHFIEKKIITIITSITYPYFLSNFLSFHEKTTALTTTTIIMIIMKDLITLKYLREENNSCFLSLIHLIREKEYVSIYTQPVDSPPLTPITSPCRQPLETVAYTQRRRQ